MQVLVISGTGTVGSHTVRELAGRQIPTAVLTHTPSKALPAGVEARIGDLRRPESLAAAMAGIDRVFLITPVSQTETEEGRNAVRAAERAGVKRVVLLSVYEAEKAPQVPHFRSKIEIEAALRASGIPHVVLMPNEFFQNDYWYRQAILDYGVYPEPVGDKGISRVDVRDIADAAVSALLEEGHEGQRYPLVGPDVLNGSDIAETWSRHLGREIRYSGNDLEAWGHQAREMLPAWMVEDLKTMYALFQQHGLKASDADFRQQAGVLHHAPRDYDSFVGETARAWRAAA